ncbi:MAG: rRNA maturation RNase YbeY [Syntrophales bacterium]|nr:rRNA maturation RNase YbeY [Syntrophales bacterium]
MGSKNNIFIANYQRKFKLNRRKILKIIDQILNLLQIRNSEISVLFLDDEKIRELNRSFLGRDRPTNVMAFPQKEGESPETQYNLLGDVVISVETASREAHEAEIPLEDELTYLLIHGILHLLGYDHESGDEKNAKLMKDKEFELFYMIKGYELE